MLSGLGGASTIGTGCGLADNDNGVFGAATCGGVRFSESVRLGWGRSSTGTACICSECECDEGIEMDDSCVPSESRRDA